MCLKERGNMEILMSSIEKKLEQKVKELYELGREAKQLAAERRQEDREGLDEIYMDMASICHELRPVELVFKELYPILGDLYDKLIELYDSRKI